MVCIYCGGDTQVTNSRHQRQVNNIWRRRQCSACKAIFTTHEKADLAGGISVRSQKSQEPLPFLRDKLFLSVLRSCQHRPAALQEAADLTQTIIAKLGMENTVLIGSDAIIRTTYTVLHRFDPTAATFYAAYHPLK